METILLAWNPDRYPWGDFQDELAEIRRGGQVTDRWSVGNRTTLEPGARFFLIRLGVEPRGLVGSGWTTSTPFEAPHWDLDRAEKGQIARYADIYFDVLEETPIIPMDELAQSPLSDAHWSTQMSGIQIPESVASAVEAVWVARTSKSKAQGMEELEDASETTRHHAARVYVNRYERSSRARALCLAHYGLKCVCCDTLLADVYGKQAAELIHVHHLTPLASIPEGAEIDPIHDLRPVCPNCHCVIHTHKPPFTIEEMRVMIAQSKQSANKASLSTPAPPRV
jgi:5-methylcytosine-specific restriction protein A